jgi:putative hemolysin
VTLHDLIEAIVGDLPDEDDEYEPNIVEDGKGGYLISGKTTIHELNKFFDRDVLGEEVFGYATIAGYLLGNIGKMPKIGEKYEF